MLDTQKEKLYYKYSYTHMVNGKEESGMFICSALGLVGANAKFDKHVKAKGLDLRSYSVRQHEGKQ